MTPACWDPVSQIGKDFVQSLLQVDPDRRLTAEQALRHPWIELNDANPIVEIDAVILDGLMHFCSASKVIK
jgi:calcium-dependent protein kinase